MNRQNRRVRAAIGSSVAAAAFGVAFAASSAAASTPPTDPPGSAAPEPAADGDREALVDTIVSTSAEAGMPMNRDCVAGLVAQVPEADIATVASEIEASATATQIEIPDIELPDLGSISIPEIELPDLGAISIPEIEIPGISIPDIELPDLGSISIPEIEIPDFSMPDLSIPSIADIELSPASLALSQSLVTCVEGDADPALVEQVVDLAASSAPEGMLDLDCAAKMLSTFPDEVLQTLIDAGAVQADPTAVDPSIAAEVSKLLACTDLSSVAGTVGAAADSVDAAPAPVTTTG